MSLRIGIEAVLDDAQVKTQQAELEAKNEKIKDAIEENEKKTKEAFDNAIGAMRAGYMVISGITQAMGGSMSQAFTAIYGTLTAGIQTYIAFTAVELAKGPAGWLTAALMSASLTSAIISLAGVLTGQEEFASQILGLNMAIQGIGGLLDSMPFG